MNVCEISAFLGDHFDVWNEVRIPLYPQVNCPGMHSNPAFEDEKMSRRVVQLVVFPKCGITAFQSVHLWFNGSSCTSGHAVVSTSPKIVRRLSSDPHPPNRLSASGRM